MASVSNLSSSSILAFFWTRREFAPDRTLAFFAATDISTLVLDAMHFLRRFGGPIATIIGLIVLSVIAVVSIGEGFKSFIVRRDGIKLRRRDGSTLTFSMPWK